MFSILKKIADNFSLHFSFLNRKDSPTNKLASSELENTAVIQTGNVGGNITQTTIYGTASESRPSLDIKNFGASGGSNGYFFYYRIRNDGNETARNVRTQFKDGSNLIYEAKVQNLIPTEETQQLSYEYTGGQFFTSKLEDPLLVVEYNATNGRQFRSGVKLIQKNRADQNYEISTDLGEYFDEVL